MRTRIVRERSSRRTWLEARPKSHEVPDLGRIRMLAQARHRTLLVPEVVPQKEGGNAIRFEVSRLTPLNSFLRKDAVSHQQYERMLASVAEVAGVCDALRLCTGSLMLEARDVYASLDGILHFAAVPLVGGKNSSRWTLMGLVGYLCQARGLRFKLEEDLRIARDLESFHSAHEEFDLEEYCDFMAAEFGVVTRTLRRPEVVSVSGESYWPSYSYYGQEPAPVMPPVPAGSQIQPKPSVTADSQVLPGPPASANAFVDTVPPVPMEASFQANLQSNEPMPTKPPFQKPEEKVQPENCSENRTEGGSQNRSEGNLHERVSPESERSSLESGQVGAVASAPRGISKGESFPTQKSFHTGNVPPMLRPYVPMASPEQAHAAESAMLADEIPNESVNEPVAAIAVSEDAGSDEDAGMDDANSDGVWCTLVRPRTGEEYLLPLDETLTLGRSPDCSVQLLGNPDISRHQATILCEEDSCVLCDLGSANGTRVHGYELGESESARLLFGEKFKLAGEPFFVRENPSLES